MYTQHLGLLPIHPHRPIRLVILRHHQHPRPRTLRPQANQPLLWIVRQPLHPIPRPIPRPIEPHRRHLLQQSHTLRVHPPTQQPRQHGLATIQHLRLRHQVKPRQRLRIFVQAITRPIKAQRIRRHIQF